MADEEKPATGSSDNDSAALGDAGKRALQAERERARKAEADAKAAREELTKAKADQDTSKSEIQKVMDKLAAMEKRAEEADTRALRSEVAAAKGVPVGLLSGSTKEELESSADALIEFRGEKKPADDEAAKTSPAGGDEAGKPAPPSRPTELREGSGAAPTGQTAEDIKKIADEVIGGR